MTDALSLWIAQNNLWFTIIVLVVGIWTAIWKGIALWKSARKSDLAWFVVFVIVNLVGILEILYIFWFSKIGRNKVKKKKRK